jgi:hypothetical protein
MSWKSHTGIYKFKWHTEVMMFSVSPLTLSSLEFSGFSSLKNTAGIIYAVCFKMQIEDDMSFDLDRTHNLPEVARFYDYVSKTPCRVPMFSTCCFLANMSEILVLENSRRFIHVSTKKMSISTAIHALKWALI